MTTTSSGQACLSERTDLCDVPAGKVALRCQRNNDETKEAGISAGFFSITKRLPRRIKAPAFARCGSFLVLAKIQAGEFLHLAARPRVGVLLVSPSLSRVRLLFRARSTGLGNGTRAQARTKQ